MRCRGEENDSFTGNFTRQTLFIHVFFSYPDRNPTLEVKYRSKKNRDKDAELERQYSTPSTPDYKSEKRRGSKVSTNFLKNYQCKKVNKPTKFIKTPMTYCEHPIVFSRM